MEKNRPFSLPKGESLFKEYTDFGKPVALSQGNDYTVGFVKSEDNQFVYLQPTYISRVMPIAKDTMVETPIIEENFPTKVKKTLITKIEVADWDHITQLARNKNIIAQRTLEEELSKKNYVKPNFFEKLKTIYRILIGR
ncbi:MAG: hypothetical protein KC516_01085 [Nanoarchaeota archaeon]|nr:hypothetical protein [Nanoarchaeota archaeon]